MWREGILLWFDLTVCSIAPAAGADFQRIPTSSYGASQNGSGDGDSTEVTLPPLPQYAGADTTDAEMAEQVATYLRQLLELPAVTASRPFLGLLNDHDGAGGAESSGTVPVRFPSPSQPKRVGS